MAVPWRFLEVEEVLRCRREIAKTEEQDKQHDDSQRPLVNLKGCIVHGN